MRMSRSTAAPRAERQDLGVSDGATKPGETRRRIASSLIVRPVRTAMPHSARGSNLAWLMLLCQLGWGPLRHAHELTPLQFLGRFEAEPVADPAMDLRQ